MCADYDVGVDAKKNDGSLMALDVHLVHRSSDEPLTSIYDEVTADQLAEIEARVRMPLASRTVRRRWS